MPAPIAAAAAIPLIIPIADRGLAAWQDHNHTKRHNEREETIRIVIAAGAGLTALAVGVKHAYGKWKVARYERLEDAAEARGDTAGAESARASIRAALDEPSAADAVLGVVPLAVRAATGGPIPPMSGLSADSDPKSLDHK